jgi:hypothetical protein
LTLCPLAARVPPHVAIDGDAADGTLDRHPGDSPTPPIGALVGDHRNGSGDPKDGDAFRSMRLMTGEGGSWMISPPVWRARGPGGRGSRL